MRLPQYLMDQHVRFESVVHPPAFTAQKRARFLGIPGRQVVKSILLVSDRLSGGTLSGGTRFVLAVLPATQRIDLEAVARFLGYPVRLADEDAIAEFFRDCERGCLTPFGSLYGLPTVLEASIDPEMTIVFEAEMHAFTIKMRCRDFEALEKPSRCQFAI